MLKVNNLSHSGIQLGSHRDNDPDDFPPPDSKPKFAETLFFKLDNLKKYGRVFKEFHTETYDIKPMLILKPTFFYKMEQVFDTLTQKVKKVKSATGLNLSDAIRDYFRFKSNGNQQYQSQWVADFVYSADKYGDHPVVAFLLQNLEDGFDV